MGKMQLSTAEVKILTKSTSSIHFCRIILSCSSNLAFSSSRPFRISSASCFWVKRFCKLLLSLLTSSWRSWKVKNIGLHFFLRHPPYDVVMILTFWCKMEGRGCEQVGEYLKNWKKEDSLSTHVSQGLSWTKPYEIYRIHTEKNKNKSKEFGRLWERKWDGWTEEKQYLIKITEKISLLVTNVVRFSGWKWQMGNLR